MMRNFLLVAMTSLPLAAFAAPLQTITLDVKNMTCPVCPITVRKALEQVPGVSAATVDFQHKTATVTYDPGKVAAKGLTDATANAGFPASVHAQP